MGTVLTQGPCGRLEELAVVCDSSWKEQLPFGAQKAPTNYLAEKQEIQAFTKEDSFHFQVAARLQGDDICTVSPVRHRGGVNCPKSSSLTGWGISSQLERRCPSSSKTCVLSSMPWSQVTGNRLVKNQEDAPKESNGWSPVILPPARPPHTLQALQFLS